MRTHLLLIPITLTLLSTPAHAQSQPAAPADPALRGPAVTPAQSPRRTLVQRDFDGKLKRLDTDPVAAALDLLDLSREQRAPADAVLNERAAAMDSLVRDHLKEIAELAAARQAGDQPRARELLRDLLKTAQPITAKGPLLDQVAATLPADKATELKRLVNEYLQAAAEDRLDNGAPDAAPAGRARAARPGKAQAAIAERLAGLGGEIKRAYERVFASRAKDFEKSLKELGLSPEQESRVQKIFTDLFQKTYGKPTRAQSTRAFLEAYALMNDEQRARLRDLIAGRRADHEAPNAVTPSADQPQPPAEIPTPKDPLR